MTSDQPDDVARCPRCGRPVRTEALPDGRRVFVLHNFLPAGEGGVVCHGSRETVEEDR